MDRKKNIIIYGSKEFSNTIKYLVINCDHNFIGFIDDYEKGNNILGSFEEVCSKYKNTDHEIALAVGYNDLAARWNLFLKIKKAGYVISTLIHPKAIVSESTILKEGCFIMAGAIIDIESTLEEIAVVWPGAVVNHNCNIGSNTFLSPNSTICGSVKIGKNCFIGASAVIADHINVPDNSFVKAGTVYKIMGRN